MEFVVSSDFEDQYFQISPFHAKLILSAFRKELSYWTYRSEKYAAKIGKKATCEQLITLTEMEGRANFYRRQVQELINGIDHCKRRDSRGSE